MNVIVVLIKGIVGANRQDFDVAHALVDHVDHADRLAADQRGFRPDCDAFVASDDAEAAVSELSRLIDGLESGK